MTFASSDAHRLIESTQSSTLKQNQRSVKSAENQNPVSITKARASGAELFFPQIFWVKKFWNFFCHHSLETILH